jgi:hypothetical protein
LRPFTLQGKRRVSKLHCEVVEVAERGEEKKQQRKLRESNKRTVEGKMNMIW